MLKGEPNGRSGLKSDEASASLFPSTVSGNHRGTRQDGREAQRHTHGCATWGFPGAALSQVWGTVIRPVLTTILSSSPL